MSLVPPIEIKKIEESMIFAKWDDGFESTIRLKSLRDECPSADSREEREKMIDNPFFIPTIKKGRNELVSLETVGNYAIKAVWGDGHDTGIYSWDMFRQIFVNHKLTDIQIHEIMSAKPKDIGIPQLKVREN